MNHEMEENITVLIHQEQIEQRLEEMASEIMSDFPHQTVTLICLLKGAVIFMVDLARKIKGPVEFDFMDISSYGDATVSNGTIKINKDLTDSITGKYVLLVEDIIDSGRTLSHVVKRLKAMQPKELKICTLLDKPDRRVVADVTPDYVGFVIPDQFVIGFGLDYAQKYRNLPYIGVLDLG